MRACASATSMRCDTDDGFTVEVTTGMGVPQFAPRTVTIPGGVQVHGR